MKRIAVAAVIAASLVPAAGAAAETRGVCTWEATLEQSYGLTMTASESRFHTPEPGTITCKGTFGDHQVDGTGTISFRGYTADTWCGAGTGYVDVLAVLPTLDGGKHKMRTRADWFRYGLLGFISGGLRDGSSYRGPFEAQPLDGDCKSEPVRRVTLRSQLVFD